MYKYINVVEVAGGGCPRLRALAGISSVTLGLTIFISISSLFKLVKQITMVAGAFTSHRFK